MTHVLNFNVFMRNADIKGVAKDILDANKKVISLEDPSKNELILVLDNIYDVLSNIDKAVSEEEKEDGKAISNETKMKLIQKLLAVHQALLEYKRQSGLDVVVEYAIEKLARFYPLFLIGEIDARH